jgi:gliding motility-associated-like protein
MQKKIFVFIISFVSVLPNGIAQTINLTNGLKMYFPFTGNATDASGNGNIATVNGPVLANDRFGTPNSAYLFDGIDDYISTVNGPGMKPQYPFSFSCWVNMVSTTPASVNFLYCNDYTIPGDDYYGSIYNTPGLRFQGSVGDGQFVDPSSRQTKTINQPLNLNTWYHVAVIISSPTSMRLFINCEEVAGTYSGTGSGMVYSPNNTGIMGRGNGGVGENYLNAYLDEVRFYDRALNDAEIGALYYYPVFPPALSYTLPVNTLDIQCGSSVNIDGTAQGILTYTWSDNTTGPTKTFTTPGTYIVEVDDGCFTNTDTLIVTGSNTPSTVTITGPTVVCEGEAVTLTASGATTYTWTPAAGLNIATGPTVTATITDTTTYSVIGTSACGNDTATVTLNTVTRITPGFTYSIDECTGGVSVVNVGDSTANYIWLTDEGDTTTATVALITFMNAGNHTISLISNPGTSCADTLTQNVTTTAAEEPLIYIPNSFTPNGNGTNENFGIYTAQTCLEGELFIFNNWGEQIYYTNQPFTDFWNGKYKDEKVPVGVYAYRLILNSGKSYYGMVALIR